MANTTIPSELIQADVALGGSPTTTTQSASDNTTKIATTAYVTAAVNALIDSAPGTMNTLNEIAAALNDDAAFNTTVTNAIATKLPLSGGTMTGNITLGDNNKAIFGAGSDLQIYHDGSHSIITDQGTGSLLLRGTAGVFIQNAEGTENIIGASADGAVTLYYDNASKLATTSTGIDVTGNVTAVNGIFTEGNSGAAATSGSANNLVLENNSNAGLTIATPANGIASIFYSDPSSNAAGYVQYNHNTDLHTIHSTGDIYLDSTGVGIGTSNPTRNLTVQTSDQTDIAIIAANDQSSILNFGDTDDDNVGRIQYNHSTNLMTFRTNTADAMYIDSSGNVGIGTSTPIENLDISGYQGISVNNNYAHMGSTVSGAMAIFGHNIKSDSGGNTIKSANTGYHSSMIKMYYNEGITFHATSGTTTAGDVLYNVSGTTNELMRITNSGNVGIGSISPDSILHIEKPSGNNTYLQIKQAGVESWQVGMTASSTALSFLNSGTERMRIDSGGDLTVGTSSAGFHFDVSTQLLSTTFGTGGNLSLACSNSSGAGLGSEIFLGGSTRGDVNRNSILFKNGASATQYSIDRNGTLMSAAVDSSYGHNTYAHAAVFTRNSTPHGTVVIEDSDVSSGIGNTVLKCYLRDQDPATLANFINFSDGGGTVGSITHNDDGGGVSFNTTSDYRLKENVDYDWDALTLVNQLRPAKFNFISNSAQTVQGFLAHEVSDIVPSSVRGDKDHMMEIGTITDSDGNVVQEEVYEHFCKEGQTWTQTGTEPLYQQLDYARLVPLLTKAIQEQQEQIEALQSEIQELKDNG